MKILKASKERTKEDHSALRKTVGDIIENVIENGDAALLEYNHRFDGCDRASLRISKEEIEAEVKRLVEASGKRGYIIGPDCSIHDELPEERIKWIVDAARKL